jgi:recombination protein RecT
MSSNIQNQQAVAVVSDKGTLEGLMANGTFQNSLATVLPKHLTPERVVKMALVAASRQPLLFKCTKESFLQSIMKSAELGLDCSGTLGRAYLVPYYNSKIGAYECQFIPGYQGLIELARRSGNIARIESRVVYENDTFEIEYGLDQKLIHKPKLGNDRGDMQCVYALAELTDGTRQFEVMTPEEVEAIRSRSKARDNGPWKTDYSEMSRKTVIRRLAKYLPLTTELAKAFEADDEQFNGHTNDVAGEIAERTRATAASLKDRLTVVKPEEPATMRSKARSSKTSGHR